MPGKVFVSHRRPSMPMVPMVIIITIGIMSSLSYSGDRKLAVNRFRLNARVELGLYFVFLPILFSVDLSLTLTSFEEVKVSEAYFLICFSHMYKHLVTILNAPASIALRPSSLRPQMMTCVKDIISVIISLSN